MALHSINDMHHLVFGQGEQRELNASPLVDLKQLDSFAKQTSHAKPSLPSMNNRAIVDVTPPIICA